MDACVSPRSNFLYAGLFSDFVNFAARFEKHGQILLMRQVSYPRRNSSVGLKGTCWDYFAWREPVLSVWILWGAVPAHDRSRCCGFISPAPCEAAQTGRVFGW
jgi:hypothetical protein